jgi:magnesium transporter
MSGKHNQWYAFNSETYTVQKDLDDFHFLKDLDGDKLTHWLNFHYLPDSEELLHLTKCADLHRTTREDILELQQRPKVEEFTSYLYFSVASVLPSKPGEVRTEQISFILNKNYLISIQEKSRDHFQPVRERIKQNTGIVRTKKADYLLYRLLDALIDNYFEVLEHIAARIEKIDVEIINAHHANTLQQIEESKRELIYLRKIVVPFKEIISRLDKGFPEHIAAENQPYFNDLKDNTFSLLDEIDTHKQILDSLAQLHFAAISHRMNEIMKMLTMVGTIFIPLTFIAGIYGMNFDFMPELNWRYGYFGIWGVMLAISIGLLIYFRKRKWL